MLSYGLSHEDKYITSIQAWTFKNFYKLENSILVNEKYSFHKFHPFQNMLLYFEILHFVNIFCVYTYTENSYFTFQVYMYAHLALEN